MLVTEAPLDVALGVLSGVPEFDPDDGPHGTWAQSARTRLDSHDRLILVAGEPGALPGGALIAYDRYQDGSLYCWLAGVVPAARRQGALTALMTIMKARAAERGYRAIRIGTQNRFGGMLTYLVKDGYLITEVVPAADAWRTRVSLQRPLP
jgi:hypothetical protein